MGVMSNKQFSEICDEIDKQTLIKLKDLLEENLPGYDPFAAMMYILTTVSTKSIYGVRPDIDSRKELVDEFGKNVKACLESIKDASV